MSKKINLTCRQTLIDKQTKNTNDQQIDRTISRALSVAVDDAKKFDINVSQDDIRNCPLDHVPVVNYAEQNSDDAFVDLGIACDDKLIEYENLRDYHTDVNKTPDEESRFVNVVGSSGIKTIRKSSLIWTLSNSKEKLSSDRLRRVRGHKKPYRQLEFIDISVLNQLVYKANEIKIGDWCVFQNVFETNENGFVLGNILSFRYVAGKTNADKKYSWDFASVQQNSDKKEVEMLAPWYQMNLHTTPTLKHIRNTYIHMQYYVANLSSDVIEKNPNSTICLSKKNSKFIKNLLPNLK